MKAICILTMISWQVVQIPAQNLAERLGYPRDTKLLMVHADDLGSAHSVNVASIDGLENGTITSASVMVPCAWTREVAQYAKRNENHDIGIHLTVTCEWKNYKWGPVAATTDVPTLINEFGFFHEDCASFANEVDMAEVEKELRAQIDQAIRLGISPTHLDSHMGCLFWTKPEIFKIYHALSREYDIPCLIEKEFGALYPEIFKEVVGEQDVIVDAVFSPGPVDYQKGMARYYQNVIEHLKPGFNMIIIHAGYDNAELQAVTIDHPDWGAAWRQADYDYFSSEACAKLIEQEEIQLITWRDIKRASH